MLRFSSVNICFKYCQIRLRTAMRSRDPSAADSRGISSCRHGCNISLIPPTTAFSATSNQHSAADNVFSSATMAIAMTSCDRLSALDGVIHLSDDPGRQRTEWLMLQVPGPRHIHDAYNLTFRCCKQVKNNESKSANTVLVRAFIRRAGHVFRGAGSAEHFSLRPGQPMALPRFQWPALQR